MKNTKKNKKTILMLAAITIVLVGIGGVVLVVPRTATVADSSSELSADTLAQAAAIDTTPAPSNAAEATENAPTATPMPPPPLPAEVTPVVAEPEKSAAAIRPTSLDSGSCGANGSNLTWVLSRTDTLTIRGAGAMESYGDDKAAPWDAHQLKAVVVGSGVTSIGKWAFSKCSLLSSVSLPSSVTSIGNGAFFDCDGLTSIALPSGVTVIDEWAFSECGALASVAIPGSVTSIGGYAFSGCNGLTSVTIPSGVTSIGERAFNWCDKLRSVTCLRPDPPAINANVFKDVDKRTCTLYVPKTSVAKYREADGWKEFESVKAIGE